jgi:hypothetical protein
VKPGGLSPKFFYCAARQTIATPVGLLGLT